MNFVYLFKKRNLLCYNKIFFEIIFKFFVFFSLVPREEFYLKKVKNIVFPVPVFNTRDKVKFF
jgi:hypothetical protein